jgi:hypothetical protein
MTTAEMSDLLKRVRALEDERDIARLIASYGPRVDSADADGTAALWATDGFYDVEGWRMNSSDDVHRMVSSASHRELVDGGCCHFLGPAVVTVTGDTAIAMCESLVLLRSQEVVAERLPYAGWRHAATEYVVWRATANHFELRRFDDGWRIVARTSRMLDGKPQAHDLLIAGLAGTRPARGEGEF